MSCLKSQIVVEGSGVPITQENLVEFHLLYSGPLHSSGYDLSRAEKHSIRKVFHSQLRRLWETQPNLHERAVVGGYGIHSEQMQGRPAVELSNPEAFLKGIEEMGRNWNRSGFNFLPLVTARHCLRCTLEILFLRIEEKNYILQGADIDGRL
jgi:hypothetical protein